jgi:hypothetical protein
MPTTTQRRPFKRSLGGLLASIVSVVALVVALLVSVSPAQAYWWIEYDNDAVYNVDRDYPNFLRYDFARFHTTLHDYGGHSCGTADLDSAFDVKGAGSENAAWFNRLAIMPKNVPSGSQSWSGRITVYRVNPHATLDSWSSGSKSLSSSFAVQPNPHPKKYAASSGSTFPSPSVLVTFTAWVYVSGHGNCSTGAKLIYFKLY